MARVSRLDELMSLAAAIEREAVKRYTEFAAAMTARGDHGLAATFQALLEEERDHLDGIDRWSRAATGAPPGAAAAAWRLPPEIARSWDEVAENALLTPYRALSIAVLNEERGFAFYSDVAAHAEDKAVREAAERLAAEELNHAALLRRERRRAFRREQDDMATRRALPPTSASGFVEDASRLALDAARKHAAIAAGLRALGAEADAAVLAAIAEEELASARASARAPIGAAGTPDEALSGQSRQQLLRGGLAEAERLYDFYVDVVDHAGAEPVLRAAQQGAIRATHHLSRIAARLHAPAGAAPR